MLYAIWRPKATLRMARTPSTTASRSMRQPTAILSCLKRKKGSRRAEEICRHPAIADSRSDVASKSEMNCNAWSIEMDGKIGLQVESGLSPAHPKLRTSSKRAIDGKDLRAHLIPTQRLVSEHDGPRLGAQVQPDRALRPTP